MTAAQWEALKKGQGSGTEEEMMAIIKALDVPEDAILPLDFFYQSVLGKRPRRAMGIMARRTHDRISTPREGGEADKNR